VLKNRAVPGFAAPDSLDEISNDDCRDDKEERFCGYTEHGRGIRVTVKIPDSLVHDPGDCRNIDPPFGIKIRGIDDGNKEELVVDVGDLAREGEGGYQDTADRQGEDDKTPHQIRFGERMPSEREDPFTHTIFAIGVPVILRCPRIDPIPIKSVGS